MSYSETVLEHVRKNLHTPDGESILEWSKDLGLKLIALETKKNFWEGAYDTRGKIIAEMSEEPNDNEAYSDLCAWWDEVAEAVCPGEDPTDRALLSKIQTLAYIKMAIVRMLGCNPGSVIASVHQLQEYKDIDHGS